MDPLDPTTARLIDAALTISDAASTEARVEMSTLRRYLHPAANAYRAAHPTPPPVSSPSFTEAQEARIRSLAKAEAIIAIGESHPAPAVPDTVKALREAGLGWADAWKGIDPIKGDLRTVRLLRAIDADAAAQKAAGAP